MDWALRSLHAELFKVSNTSVTVLSVMVFFATIIASVVAGKVASRGITRFFRHRGDEYVGTAYALGRIFQYLLLAAGVLIGLQNIGVNLSALTAIGALVGVGIGFGLQNITQNFVSGIILLVERPVQKGDFIMVGTTVGVVSDIAMRATTVITRDGIAIIVPNADLVSGRVVNLSQPTTVYRVMVTVGVAYGTSTELVRDTLLEVARAHPQVVATPAPTVFFQDFGDSALQFALGVWIDDPQPEGVIMSDLRFAIDRAFREHGIEIPFPQRELHLSA